MLSACLKESVGFVRWACVSFKLPRSLGDELNHEKLHFGFCELYFFFARSPTLNFNGFAKTLERLSYARFTNF
jgi:hypothetical protein